MERGIYGANIGILRTGRNELLSPFGRLRSLCALIVDTCPACCDCDSQFPEVENSRSRFVVHTPLRNNLRQIIVF